MRVVVITGASSGIGKEFALQLDKGLSTIDEFWLVARNEERLEELASRLTHKARLFPMDITEEENLESLEMQLMDRGAKVSMLIACAGVGYIGDFQDLSNEKHLEVIRLNCEALTNTIAHVVPYMHQNARIITLASSSAFLPQPGFASYAASKSYVYSLSKAIGQELKCEGIYLTCVCPGPVDTPFLANANKTGEGLALKKLFTADPKAVVQKALRDSAKKRSVSIYGISMKAFSMAVKMLPQDLFLKYISLLRK